MIDWHLTPRIGSISTIYHGKYTKEIIIIKHTIN